MKRKLSIIAIAMLLVLTLAFALVACKPKKPVIDPVEKYPQGVILNKVMAGHGYGEDAVLSTSFKIGIDVNGEKHNVAIKTNLNDKQSEVFFEITDSSNLKVLGLYIVNGKIYLDFGAGNAKVYLADFDVSDMVKIALEADLIKEFDNILAGTDYTFDSLFAMISELMFSEATLTKEGDIEVYTMRVQINALFELITTMVGELDINKILFDMGINVDLNINDIILGIVIPKDLTVKLVAKMSGNTTLSTQIIGNIAEAALFDISLDGGVYSSLQDLGFPSDILEYQAFSLTNICFDATLNIASDKLDIADIVNLLTGAKTLPKGVLIFNSNKDFSVKFRMDLDIDDNMKNLVFIDIFAGKNFDSKLVGIYFYEGLLYIDYQSVLPNGTKLSNMKIEGIDISKQLRDLVGMITGTIAADTSNAQGVKAITTKTSDAVLSPDLIAFANSVINLVGVNDNIKVGSNKISIKINSQLIDMISGILSDVDITYPEFLGDIDLDINLSNKGIDTVDITANLPDYNSVLKVNLNNFNIGFYNGAIEELITNSIKDKSFVTDYSQILDKAMEGMLIEGQIKLNLPKGEYDLSDLFKMFDLNLPSIKYQLTDGIVDEIFDITIKMQLDKENKNNNNIAIELTAIRDKVFCKAGLFLGIYHKENAMYIDASNITVAGLKLPIMKLDIDLASLITNEISKLGYGNLYNEAGDPLFIEEQNKSSITAVNDIFELNIDNKKLVILATSKAIANLLAGVGVDVTLPEFTVNGEITSLNDISVKLASGELNIDLDITNTVIGEKQTFDFEFTQDTYYEDIIVALVQKLTKLDLMTTIDISSRDGVLDLTTFINGILSATGNSLQVPVELVMANYNSRVTLLVKWNIDIKNSANTELLLELRDQNDALILGFYLFNDNTYIDVPAIQAKFRVENLGLSKQLGNAFASIQDSIALNIGDILKDLIAGKDITTTPKSSVTNMADEIVLPADFVKYLFEGISIKNTAFGIEYTAELMSKLLLSIGVDTGADASLVGSMDVVEGTLNLKGSIGFLALDINSKVVTLGETVAIGLSDEMFTEFLVLDATNGVTLTNTLFSEMAPNLNVDIFTNNIDVGNGTKFTRLEVHQAITARTVAGVELQPDDIIIALKDETKLNNDKICIYIFITDTMLYIRGTNDWFVGGFLNAVKGSAIAVQFPMELKSMLYSVLDDALAIIKPIDTATQKSITTNVADSAELAIDSLLKKVQISIMDTDQSRISVQFNASIFNKLISDTINDLLHNTSIEGMPAGVDLSKITYSSTEKSLFVNGLWTHFLSPYISSILSDAEWLVAKSVLEEKFKELFIRLIPFPQADEVFLNVNIDQNKLSSIEFNIRDNANNRYTEIDIINKASEGAIDWATAYEEEMSHSGGMHYKVNNKIQATYIEYDPYGTDKLSNYFNSQARLLTNGAYSYQKIVWTYMVNGKEEAFDPAKTVLPYREDNEPYEIKGNAFGQTIIVKVKILSSTSIVGIKTITMSPYAKFPSTVEIMLADGTTREVAYSAVKDIAPTTYKAHTQQGKVTLAGADYDITVKYQDSTVKNVLGGTDKYINVYEYGLGNYLLPEHVNLQLNYGGHINLAVTYDYSEITNEIISVEGAVKNVKMYINKGTVLEQEINITYTITPKVVQNIEFNSATYNKFNVDPYVVFKNGIDAYQKNATVYYNDGSHEKLDLVWDIANVTNTFAGSTSIAKVSYTSGIVSWEKEITVVMARRDAMYLDFDGNKVIEVNPLMWESLGKDYYFPANATVVFETGESAVLPITWDLSKLDVSNPAGSFNNITATIASGNFMQTIQVPVRVKPVRPIGVILENNVYTIDPVQTLYNNVPAFSNKLMVEFADGRKDETPVTWDAKDVVISLAGGDYKATVGVGDFNFEINVKVLARQDLQLVDNTLTINPLIYAEYGSQYYYSETLTYTANGLEYKLPVVWDASDVTIDKVGGDYTAKVTIGTGDNAIVSNVAVTVENKEIVSIGLIDNTATIFVGQTLSDTFTVTFKDGSTMNIQAKVGAFDNTEVGTYNNVTVTFFDSLENVKQEFTITVVVEIQPEIMA